MPLFKCTECHCVENTALGDYWTAKFGKSPRPVKCSECCDGKWHGKFTKQSANGYYVDVQGFLWSADEIAAGRLPAHAKIVALIQDNEVVTLTEGEKA